MLRSLLSRPRPSTRSHPRVVFSCLGALALATSMGCPGEATTCSTNADCEGEDVCRSDEDGNLTCGEQLSDPNPRARITDFFATPSPIDAGATSTLTWTSENADSCEISNSVDDGVETVAASDTLDVTPTETTDYTLDCTNSVNTATSTASVVVNRPVSIDSFAVSTTALNLGDTATLTWETTNAVSCTMTTNDEAPVGVEASDTLEVSPEETSTYVLDCTGFPEAVTASNEISVVSITDFESSDNLVAAGSSVTLTWTYSGTEQCALEFDDVDVGATGESHTLTIDDGGLHTATVSCTGASPAEDIESSLQVLASEFESIAVTPNPVAVGATATVDWVAIEVDACVLNQVSGTPAELASGLSATGTFDIENVTEAIDVQLDCTRTLGDASVTVQSAVTSITTQ